MVITSFDSANYQLSNIAALVGDYLYTSEEDLSLVVNTVPVDLNQPDKYADIKGQWKPKFVWTDYLIYIYILLGILLLGLLLFFCLDILRSERVWCKTTLLKCCSWIHTQEAFYSEY